MIARFVLVDHRAVELLVERVVDEVGAVVVDTLVHVAARAIDGVFVLVAIDVGEVLLLAD